MSGFEKPLVGKRNYQEEGKRKQRFSRMPLKGSRMADSYAKEHSKLL
jgi:hypothetical protein